MHARYYEDQGYPGHVNCTDNFNAELAPYGVAPRKGWMALNFFYNTGIDPNNVLYFDEPWSRPGDYVLLRALTDLVCVSSACPDDIDPANGWNPTDIHVRTYSGKQSFSRATAYRMTPDAEPQLTRETAFHPRFAALTRNFTAYRGYWLPNRFSNDGPVAEYWACRERAAIMDLSPLRKFEVTGPDAEALLQYALTRNVRKLAVGQVVYTAMCYEHGGMIDDGTLFRLGENNFRWIGGDDYGGIWLRELAEKLGLKAWVRSSTDQLHNVAVQGPKSRDILREVVWTPPARPTLDELGWFRFTVGRIGDFEGPSVVVSRTGLYGRARLRGLLPSEGRAHRLRRDLEGGRAAWREAARARGARHGSDRGRPRLRRLRILRPDRPVRGRNRLHRAAQSKNDDFIGRDALMNGTRTRKGSSSGSSWRARRRSSTATASMSAARRSARSRAPPARRS